MRKLRSTSILQVMPDPARLETIFAVLLWSGVTIFIFGILIDVIR